MHPEIEQLLVLQDRDQRIKRFQTELQALPREKKRLENQLQTARAHFDLVSQKLRGNAVELHKLQLEVQSKNNDLARFRTQQQQTRKNEEFQALANEIRHAENVISSTEDKELELMEAAEKFQKEVDASQVELKKTEQHLATQFAELKTKESALNDSLKDLEAQRRLLAEKVPSENLDLYQRVFHKKGDAGVVAVEHDVCSGCHMHVPSQIVMNLRPPQATPLVQCPQCGRILYRE